MAKRQKLSLQQKRRVSRGQQKKLSAQSSEIPDDASLGPLQTGIVISRYGEQADIADALRNIYRCHLRQHLGSCVTGDRVNFRLDKSQFGVIEVINPRDSELKRPTPHGGVKTVVANVDQIFTVIAPLPEYSSVLLDRYLVACELAEITTTILLNKVDLMTEDQQVYFNDQLDIYTRIGYRCLKVSTKQPAGLDELAGLMNNQENIFVGQSGVGKSSLINRLLPDASASTQEVSLNSKLGLHTTTASRLYFLPQGGHIIDSPGVREFGLWHLDPESLIKGFRELMPFAADCKFRNCKHAGEAGCALVNAVNKQLVDSSRVANYQKIYQQMAQQATR